MDVKGKIIGIMIGGEFIASIPETQVIIAVNDKTGLVECNNDNKKSSKPFLNKSKNRN